MYTLPTTVLNQPTLNIVLSMHKQVLKFHNKCWVFSVKRLTIYNTLNVTKKQTLAYSMKVEKEKKEEESNE